MRPQYDADNSGRRDVVAEACLELGVPAWMWLQVHRHVEFARKLGAEPTRETITAAIATLDIPQKPPAPPPKQVQHPVVYYIRFGDRVKIGTTFDLQARLSVIPHDEVLGTEPGSYALEKRRHRQFAADRVVGEWFRLSPGLIAHIEGLNALGEAV